MKTVTVQKPFKSARRKFKIGDEIGESDDVAPHTIESLQDWGAVGSSTDDERQTLAAPADESNQLAAKS